MIDDEFKVFLIEVNQNPCLETGCPVLNRIVSRMLNDALKIGLDPLFMPPKNFIERLKKFHFFEIFAKENKF